jgi:Helix-turn-helix domain
MTKVKLSQEILILKHLEDNPITPLEALELYGCFRLAAIIHTLRAQHYKITTFLVFEGDKHWAQYSLEQEL